LRDRSIAAAFLFALALLAAAAWALAPRYGAIRTYQVASAETIAQNSRSFEIATAPLNHRTSTSTSKSTGTSAIFLPSHSRPLTVEVDGKALAETAIKRVEGLNRRRAASLITLPDRIATAPPSKITLHSNAEDGSHQFAPVYYGDARAMKAAAQQQTDAITLSRTILTTALTISIAIAFLLIFFSRSPMRYVYLLATVVVLAIINFERRLTLSGVPMREFSEYTQQLYVVFSFLMIAYWTNLDAVIRRKLLIAYGAIFALIVLLDITKLPNFATSDTLKNMLFYCSGVFTALFNIVQIIRSYYSRNIEYQLISVGFALGTVGVIVNILSIYFPVGDARDFMALHFSNLTGGMSVLMFTLVALYFEFQHYRTSVIQNRTLSTLVAGHNAERDLHAETLKAEIERRAILEERQRFTRDMHDGIGGQLLSLLMKARRGDVKLADFENDIANSINDLRLVAASLDGSDEGLIVSLHSVRERVRDQLDAADIAFSWSEADDLDAAALGPRETLNVLRIVQEGVTNVVRHAAARRVDIQVGFDPVHNALAIKLSDDGTGIGDAELSHPGKGLRNMRVRAEQIDATLTIGPRADGATGTLIALDVPCGGGR
jgi:signal transduction histidine kinase